MFVTNIPPVDPAVIKQAEAWMDGLIKPIGSLGKLEEIAVRLAGMTGRLHNTIGKTRVVVFAADNGIHSEDITPVPQSVTAIQAANMPKGFCGISVLCRHAGSELIVVDVGIAADMTGTAVIDRKVRPGTANIAKGPAMTREQAVAAMEVGREMAYAATDEDIGLLGVGEMGICNTSSSSAMLTAFTGLTVRETTGRGAGINNIQLNRKIAAIEEALRINAPDPADPLDVLSKVGGLDIAAMAGCFLGAAERRLPTVVDGFIAMMAALTAFRMNPGVRDYLFASHCSQEPGYRLAARELELHPMLDMDMRLGEGTGCPLAFHLIDAATRVCNEMATFEQGSVDNTDYVDIRKQPSKQ